MLTTGLLNFQEGGYSKLVLELPSLTEKLERKVDTVLMLPSSGHIPRVTIEIHHRKTAQAL